MNREKTLVRLVSSKYRVRVSSNNKWYSGCIDVLQRINYVKYAVKWDLAADSYSLMSSLPEMQVSQKAISNAKYINEVLSNTKNRTYPISLIIRELGTGADYMPSHPSLHIEHLDHMAKMLGIKVPHYTSISSAMHFIEREVLLHHYDQV